MTLRNGSRGPFWGCSTYPRCKGTRDATQAEVTAARGPLTDDERASLEATIKNLKGSIDYWRDAFFDGRSWWVMRMEVVTPALTKEQLRAIKCDDITCPTCGQRIPKPGERSRERQQETTGDN